ncbi:hypothetical protein PAXRUDRAFT_398971 [Paxillus rubicundulus Ve08.2h10]|uniref:Uncharacterized protein n=1 Tax=Paxillus rubicundulus Ve08.2h10 TaxID=930991 RepID=A0A0D0DR16_9AGAM|nr:hypothetical protein PAXRUDRAFT_398971 [Paxillus rubicundulus Ve08.2h10]
MMDDPRSLVTSYQGARKVADKDVPLQPMTSRLYRRTMVGYHERVTKRMIAVVPVVCPDTKYIIQENEHLVPREYGLTWTWESMPESEISRKAA